MGLSGIVCRVIVILMDNNILFLIGGSMETQMKTIIEQKTKKIVEKGESMSDTDLYNLCVLNHMKEIEQKNNKNLQQTSQ